MSDPSILLLWSTLARQNGFNGIYFVQFRNMGSINTPISTIPFEVIIVVSFIEIPISEK